MANKVFLLVTLALMASLVAAEVAETGPASRKLLRLGSMYAQQETAAAIERAVMSGADPSTTQAATWVGAATARAASGGRNRWGWGRGGWWDRR